MKHLKAFGLFWYDFVVGDDWTIAVAVVVAVAGTALLSHTRAPAWLVVPIMVTLVLGQSLRKTAGTSRRSRRARQSR